ncbi:hypothetical protein Bbelb_023290 [Branchiostoma belcheri]|nr:hypothetical protein Bbelb_023290 [Branchiostoma belcheri]
MGSEAKSTLPHDVRDGGMTNRLHNSGAGLSIEQRLSCHGQLKIGTLYLRLQWRPQILKHLWQGPLNSFELLTGDLSPSDRMIDMTIALCKCSCPDEIRLVMAEAPGDQIQEYQARCVLTFLC